MSQTILTVNAGSSSLKLSLFTEVETKNDPQTGSDAGDTQTMVQDLAARLSPVWSANVEPEGDNGPEVLLKTLEELWKGPKPVITGPDEIAVVGHRVVHGGPKYSASVKIDDQVLNDLKGFIQLDPTHEAANIRGIEAAQKVMPQATHVAVFDTAYHHDMPPASQIYAGPYEWFSEKQIRRFGFHGINHAYCAARIDNLLTQTSKAASAQRVITAHLGSGSSLCASLGSKSLMTTMGYTPLEGLIMRTRCGSIDAGIIFALLKNGYTADKLYDTLNKDSGLKGIFGPSGDMREIEKALGSGDERAKLAFDAFIQSLVMSIGSLIPVLGGLDALVFTGGIGENSVAVRKAACDKLGYAGVFIDETRNLALDRDRDISAPRAAVRTFVIAAGEEPSIAAESALLVTNSPQLQKMGT